MGSNTAPNARKKTMGNYRWAADPRTMPSSVEYSIREDGVQVGSFVTEWDTVAILVREAEKFEENSIRIYHPARNFYGQSQYAEIPVAELKFYL